MKPQKALLKGSDLNTHCKEINSLSSNTLFNPSPSASYNEEKNAVVKLTEEKDVCWATRGWHEATQVLSGVSQQPWGSCQGRDVLCVINNLHSDFLTVQEAFWQKPPFRSNNNSGFLLNVSQPGKQAQLLSILPGHEFLWLSPEGTAKQTRKCVLEKCSHF